MGPSTTTVRIAMAVFMCIGTIEIVEAILLGSIPSPPDSDASSSCTDVLTILLLFLKATHASFKCFSAIAVFFALSAELVLPTEMFLLWNSAAVLISVPADVFIYLIRLLEHRLPTSQYGCVPDAKEAVTVVTLARGASLNMTPEFYITRIVSAILLGFVQMLVIKQVNDYYEASVSESEDEEPSAKPTSCVPTPEGGVDALPVHLEKKMAGVMPVKKEPAGAVPVRPNPKDEAAGAGPTCPQNTPAQPRAAGAEMRHRHKQRL